MFDFIKDIQEYDFLRQALYTSIVLGISCGMIGCFIILRGLALMGDAISHAILPGVAVSYLLGISYFYGAVVFGILTALGIGYVKEHSKIKSDAAIGIVFSAFLALGIIMISKIQSSIKLDSILFGNILTISKSDRTLTYVVSLVIVLCIFLFYKELVLTSFDNTMAKAAGMPVKTINYLMMTLLTLITVVSLQSVGVILVVSLLITPAATAYLLTHKLNHMLWISALFGSVSAVLGLYFSVRYNLPSGVVIVLITTLLFILVFIFNPKTGIVWKNSKQNQTL